MTDYNDALTGESRRFELFQELLMMSRCCVSLVRMVWRHSTIKKRLVHLPLPHLLLQLHPPVLEPDLDLSLCQPQLCRKLCASLSSEEVVVVKLLLQLQDLFLRVNCPHPHQISSRTS